MAEPASASSGCTTPHNLLARIAARLKAPAPLTEAQAQPARAAILDQYVRVAPNPQIALDIFRGDWWSSMPETHPGLQAGTLPLFADGRIHFAIKAFGGVTGKTILELGPLEGGHTYSLEQAGAKSILAIESNTRAFLKCLIAKEVVGLQRSHFVLGDFEEYLRAGGERFDAGIASGVLYHMRNPVELLVNLAKVTDRIYLWTHYFVKERLAAIPHMAHRFGESNAAEHAGFRHTLYRYNYGDFLDTTRFAGGSEQFSNWLSREELLAALKHVGFSEIEIGEEEPEHTNGPCISLVARRPGA